MTRRYEEIGPMDETVETSWAEDEWAGVDPGHDALRDLARLLAFRGWQVEALGQAPEGHWRIAGQHNGRPDEIAAPTMAGLADKVLAIPRIRQHLWPRERCPVCGQLTVIGQRYDARCVRGCRLTAVQREALGAALDPEEEWDWDDPDL